MPSRITPQPARSAHNGGSDSIPLRKYNFLDLPSPARSRQSNAAASLGAASANTPTQRELTWRRTTSPCSRAWVLFIEADQIFPAQRVKQGFGLTCELIGIHGKLSNHLVANLGK